MLNFEMKRGDTPTVTWQAKDRGRALDLTDATGTIIMRRGRDAEVTFPVAIAVPLQGIFDYTFDGTLLAGSYVYEVKFIRDGVQITAPTGAAGTFTIRATIA